MRNAPFNNEIAALSQRGLSLRLTPDGEGIFLYGPKVNRTDADRQWIRTNKTDLLALLRGVTNPPANLVEALCASPDRLKVAMPNGTDSFRGKKVQYACVTGSGVTQSQGPYRNVLWAQWDGVTHTVCYETPDSV